MYVCMGVGVIETYGIHLGNLHKKNINIAFFNFRIFSESVLSVLRAFAAAFGNYRYAKNNRRSCAIAVVVTVHSNK